MRSFKKDIVEIVGFGMEPKRAELIAQQLIDLFNNSIIDNEEISANNPYVIKTNNGSAWLEGAEWLQKEMKKAINF